MSGYERIFDDNKYLEPEKLKEEVLDVLKSLELDRHRLRIQVVLNNMNTDIKLSGGSTLGEALSMISGRIDRIESTFFYLIEGNSEKL